jgi:hypothetical protein
MELKRDDRFKNQFNKVLRDINYYGKEKEKRKDDCGCKSPTMLKTMRDMYSERRLCPHLSKGIKTFWDYNQDNGRSPIEFEDYDWDIVNNMSKHLARVGLYCQEADLMEQWEDYKDDDYDDEMPLLLCVYKLYPEWGVRYLGQEKPDPWLPSDNGYFK